MDRKVVPIKPGEVIAEVGGPVDEFRVTLAIYGVDLDPDDISLRFGRKPSAAHRRGDLKGPKSPPFPSGAWLLTNEAIPPRTSDETVYELLSSLPQDKELWEKLVSQYTVQLRISIHAAGWNRGFGFSPTTALLIANTGASLEFDLYFEGDEDEV